MNKLLILAYNEQLYIEETILTYIDDFNEIIVVDDFSNDSTNEILEKLSSNYSNLNIIRNKKNVGAGKSMQIGIEEALKSEFKYLVKIDGDNQFKNTDISSILNLANANNASFVKADRFWKDGIEGSIPKIRYFGNAFASFLIKFITGNSNVNDPLNGLFVFSYAVTRTIQIPKIFHRYGYPYYINTNIYMNSLENDTKLYQYKNKVSYQEETSYIKPVVLFIKIISYSTKFYLGFIKKKLKYSDYQMSGLLDILSIFSLLLAGFFLSKSVLVRYFNVDGNQSAWFILFIMFLLFFILLSISSRFVVKKINARVYDYL
jgi:dolichol-phosphate mannosyltransferase